MNAGELTSTVQICAGKSCSRAEFFSILNTYNCFLKEKTHLHLTVHENAGQVTLEGILVISWGVKRPIQLKIQDEKQIFPSETPIKSPDLISPLGTKRGMTRWGEFDDLHHIDELEEVIQDGSKKTDRFTEDYVEYESKTLRPFRHKSVLDESSNLFRTMSDASLVKMRVKSKKMAERQKNRNYRFSINGHFYNYKTSIFTPSYGATTNVHINSQMTTQEVITQLLHKFKIENNPNEFALYCIHQSGGQDYIKCPTARKLPPLQRPTIQFPKDKIKSHPTFFPHSRSRFTQTCISIGKKRPSRLPFHEKRKLNSLDLPLWERVLQGPSDNIMKMFLMDSDEQEVSLDVAQYLNLELPILRVVLQKLEEQENKEIQRIISKYEYQRNLILQCLNKKLPVKTETTV